jgi:hypothetical protein
MAVSANAHDLFLKLDTYFFSPNSKAAVRLQSGTFKKSDNLVNRDRLQDASLIMPSNDILKPPLTMWRSEGETSIFELQTVQAGTYVIGVYTKHKELEMKAADFNNYLEHDGLPDILAERRESKRLNIDARERYSKHAKAIFQVGDTHTDNYKTPLNYPVEIIPQQNPYALKVGETLEVLCVLNGQPLINQFVMAGWDGDSSPLNARTDSNGIARFELKSSGKWYIKMIHMVPLKDPVLNYESKWASLTFEIR